MATDSRVCAGGEHTLSYSCQLEELLCASVLVQVYRSYSIYNGHIKQYYVLRD